MVRRALSVSPILLSRSWSEKEWIEVGSIRFISDSMWIRLNSSGLLLLTGETTFWLWDSSSAANDTTMRFGHLRPSAGNFLLSAFCW